MQTFVIVSSPDAPMPIRHEVTVWSDGSATLHETNGAETHYASFDVLLAQLSLSGGNLSVRRVRSS